MLNVVPILHMNDAEDVEKHLGLVNVGLLDDIAVDVFDLSCELVIIFNAFDDILAHYVVDVRFQAHLAVEVRDVLVEAICEAFYRHESSFFWIELVDDV